MALQVLRILLQHDRTISATAGYRKNFFAIFSGSMKTGILNYLGDEVWLEIPDRRVFTTEHGGVIGLGLQDETLDSIFQDGHIKIHQQSHPALSQPHIS